MLIGNMKKSLLANVTVFFRKALEVPGSSITKNIVPEKLLNFHKVPKWLPKQLTMVMPQRHWTIWLKSQIRGMVDG